MRQKEKKTMNFDKWFEEQSLVLKIILIVLPFVGWVMEILIRISAYLRSKDNMDLVLMIIFILLGWFWIPLVVDVVFLCTKGHILLASDLASASEGKQNDNKDDNKEEEKK